MKLVEEMRKAEQKSQTLIKAAAGEGELIELLVTLMGQFRCLEFHETLLEHL